MTVGSRIVDVALIHAMERGLLLASWEARFCCAPGTYVSVKLMRSMLAYEMQAASNGGELKQMDRALRQRARQLTDAQTKGKPKGSDPAEGAILPSPILRPGVQLMREWNGRTYRVEVQESGFAMDGRSYKSLTAIAKRITGAHWSGPRFFGLSGRRAA